MNIVKFDKNCTESKIKTRVIIETSFSKEIQILLPKGELMKDHQTPFPILIHILDGKIDLGVNGKSELMESGDIIALDGGIVHHLKAHENTIVRLTLSKQDRVERVNEVINS
ncbi:MAG: cupin [Flavobacteriales bacterium]|nr:MAG: cupin [Flavobacteriales bacterium]